MDYLISSQCKKDFNTRVQEARDRGDSIIQKGVQVKGGRLYRIHWARVRSDKSFDEMA